MAIIKEMDLEISHLIKKDPSRNWNKYFQHINREIIAKYRSTGKYKEMAKLQTTEITPYKLISLLRKKYSFKEAIFNQHKSTLSLINLSTNEREEVYIGGDYTTNESAKEIFDVLSRLKNAEVLYRQKEVRNAKN